MTRDERYDQYRQAKQTGGPCAVCGWRDGDGQAGERQAQVAVIDHGIGIPSEALPQLFARFYRAPNVDPQHISGLGVGLYVVKEIVELHGGLVEVVSEVGAGSTFTLVLPLAEAAEAALER